MKAFGWMSGALLLGLLLSIGVPQRVEAIITAVLESPAEGQEVAGIGIIAGWAFSDAEEVQVTWTVDGVAGSSICSTSERADVAAAFPDEPNALNSGFATAFNYEILSLGVHTVGVQITDSSGDILQITHTVVVVSCVREALSALRECQVLQ